MSVHVVVYAEGSLDAGIQRGIPRTHELEEDELGAAHLLVRRCLAGAGGLPEEAVRFRQPLRIGPRVARGSDLLDPARIRLLLTWPPGRGPRIAVVLIDADGDSGRKARIEGATKNLVGVHHRVVGVAVQEFEAWLVADETAVTRALDVPFGTPPLPETMRRREAKGLLTTAIAQAGRDSQGARRSIASLCDLEIVARLCPAFGVFRAELAAGV